MKVVTGLYWKRLPSRTFISKEEATTPGFKVSKDRLTLLLGGNAAGDFKLKPLLVYHSENPRALKNISKTDLPVIWSHNRKAWITSALFTNWFKTEFCPAVKEYCTKQNLSHKALLLIDNAPGHPSTLDEIDENVKVVFLPPNTTSLLQPMDQGVIATFKAYYLRRTFKKIVERLDDIIALDKDRQISIKEIWRSFDILKAVENIGASWEEVASSTMNKAWRKIWPESVEPSSSVDTCIDSEEINNEILQIAKTIGFNDLDETDINELINTREEPLSNEELLTISQDTELSEQNFDEEKREFSIKKLSEFLEHIEKALEILGNDPNAERKEKVSFSISNSIECYKEMYRSRKLQAAQSSLTRFFKLSTSRATFQSQDLSSTEFRFDLSSSDED